MTTRRIVELIGPAGSGKSTTLAVLRARNPAFVLNLHRANSVAGNLSAIFFTLWFGFSFRLGPADLFCLLRKCRSVENGIFELQRASTRSVLVDEGPIRCMIDTMSRTDREKIAWRSYVQRRLRKLESMKTRIELIDLAVPRHVRSGRRDARIAQTRLKRSARLGRLERKKKFISRPIDPLRSEFIDWVRFGRYQWIVHSFLELDGSETPEEVADRIFDQLVDQSGSRSWSIDDAET